MTLPGEPRSEPGAQSSGDALGHHLAGLPRRTLSVALWLLPVVALANVAVLIWSIGAIDLAERLVAPQLLALAALLVFVPTLTNTLRLTFASRFLGYRLGLARSLRVVTGTILANSLTPSAVGGMPIKVLFLIGEGIEARRAISLTSFQVAEDALSLFGLAALSATVSGFAPADFLVVDLNAAGPAAQGLRTAAVIFAGVCAVTVATGALVWAGLLGMRLRATLAGLARRLRLSLAMVVRDWGDLLRRGKAVALLNLLLACVQWSVRFSIAGLVLSAFGTAWQPALFWLLQYLVQTISSAVPSPGGVGGAEAGFLLLFAPFVEPEVLLPAMSTWRLLFFYLPLVGAALIFSALRRRARRLRRIAARQHSTSIPAE